MDPVSTALLAELAGGAGGALGHQAWLGLTALVRRPFGHDHDASAQDPAVSTGEAELIRLQAEPGDTARAQALSTALATRAAVDPEFSTDLRQWNEQVESMRTRDGDVHNTVSGGTQYGHVLQGRDFSGLTFNTTAPPPPAPGAETPSTQG
ncbi:hypothetical protein A8W25_05850 [Streptomyces sp. ERV7]|uniref:hypothetical protein n=1 Tax=Streptomyces sp. ERV7 TaxID=1322334 RepID=UPI0007F4D99D|nr:hypothetical protein [Streptomyces sp. ERV7]OAR25176.1 hypothetical protein A8W25_05850 [Streptomyces sp. ERV7]